MVALTALGDFLSHLIVNVKGSEPRQTHAGSLGVGGHLPAVQPLVPGRPFPPTEARRLQPRLLPRVMHLNVDNRNLYLGNIIGQRLV